MITPCPMPAMSVWSASFSLLENPTVWLLVVVGLIAGILAGALPGLTSTMSMALLVPFAGKIEDRQGALCLLFGLYVGAMHGGAICAILIGTPGTPAAAATVLDGYPMAKQGKAALALNLSTYASTVGGILSTVACIALAPQIALVAQNFGYHEFFLFAVFGLSVIASVSGDSLFKGLLAGVFGLLLATVGSRARFLFGGLAALGEPFASDETLPLASIAPQTLRDGIPFIPAMIGVFAVAECLLQVEGAVRTWRFGRAAEPAREHAARWRFGDAAWALPRWIWWNLRDFASSLPLMGRLMPTTLGASVAGTLVGAIPGTGGDIASFVAYQQARRWSKDRSAFGKGAPAGLVASETANNAVTGGAMIPVLTLGIPGDAVTAILLYALQDARIVGENGVVQNLKVGANFMESGAMLIGAIFGGLLLANILALPVRLVLTPLFSKAVEIPRHLLWPSVLVFCAVGAYALAGNYGLDMMLVFGLIGYGMRKAGIPAGPLILGLILGPIAEEHLANALRLSGGASGFYTRPMCLGMEALLVGGLLLRLWQGLRITPRPVTAKTESP